MRTMNTMCAAIFATPVRPLPVSFLGGGLRTAGTVILASRDRVADGTAMPCSVSRT